MADLSRIDVPALQRGDQVFLKPGAEVHWDEFKQNGTTPAALSKQYIVQPFVITSVSTTARGENLYEAAPLAAHVNLPSDMSLLSPIKFKPQTRVIKLSKAHKANPRVYRIVENELLHDTRPDTSLAPDTPSEKANICLTNAKAPMVVKCVIVDRRGGTESVFQDELMPAPPKTGFKDLASAAKLMQEAVTPEERSARKTQLQALVAELRNPLEEKHRELEDNKKGVDQVIELLDEIQLLLH